MCSDGSQLRKAGSQMALIFVLSAERSGSTLLSSVLAGHSAIDAGPELHLLRHSSLSDARQTRAVAAAFVDNVLANRGLSVDTLCVEAADNVWRFYELVSQGLGARHYLVDKTPAYARSEDQLRRIIGLQPKIIWLLRNPFAVSLSILRRRQELQRGRASRSKNRIRRWWRERLEKQTATALTDGKPPVEQIDYWLQHNETIARALQSADVKYMKIHYELFLLQPADTCESICTYLDINYEPAMLNFAVNVPSTIQWGLGDEKLKGTTSFDISRIDEWRQFFRPDLLDQRRQQRVAALLA